jgi:hypothetical protein
MTEAAMQAAPRASAPIGLPLLKRKMKRSPFDTDKEPSTVLLCDNGKAICESLGVRSAHIKRSANTPHVAVTVKHPDTGKRVSIALWKLVTTRVEAGWSVEYLNDQVTDLRLENLKTVSPAQRDEQAEADAEHITDFNAQLASLPLSAAQLAKIERQRQVFEHLSTQEQKDFYKYLCGVASSKIKNNFELTEDKTSEIFAFEVWPLIMAGKCDDEDFIGLRRFAAGVVAFHAENFAKLTAGGHCGHTVPERPRHLAKHRVKLLEYIPEVTDAVYAEENNFLPARPTHVGDADDQWSRTFGKQVGAMEATRSGLSYRTGAEQEEPLHVDDLDVRDIGLEAAD